MTPRGAPRALLWDVGNVIVRWDPRTLYAKIFKEPADLDRFLSHVCTLDCRDLLFVDDSAANIAAAEAMGFHTHHFTDPAALRPAIARHGLL